MEGKKKGKEPLAKASLYSMIKKDVQYIMFFLRGENNMTFNQLEYFCSVCRYHSISRAAQELFVSQPTVSVAIRDLEKEFHLKLLNHQKNRISITAEGEQFYQRAEQLLKQRREMYMEFSDLAQNQTPLKIGIPPIISLVFFPRLADAFLEKNQIPLQLLEYGSARARALVYTDALDLAFVNMDFPNVDQYHSHQIMEDTIVYCVSRTHPYFKEKKITMEMLSRESIVLFNTDSVLNRMIFSKYEAAGIKPRVFMYSSQLYTILNVVRGGGSGAFLYASVAVNPLDFVQIPLYPKSTARFGLIWKKGGFISQRLSRFIDFVKKYDMAPYQMEEGE